MKLRVTDEQKASMKILYLYEKKTPDEIRVHESMKREDGSYHRIETIKMWLKRLEETGSMSNLPKSGRPRKLNQCQEKDLIKFIKKNPKIRYPVVKRSNNLDVSRRTINRLANNHGIRTFRCIKRPIISLKNSKHRLQMAKMFLKNQFLIDRIVFTDEKKFANSSSKVEYVNRLPGEAYKEKHMTVNKIGTSAADLNIWGYVGSFGKGDIMLHFYIHIFLLIFILFYPFKR